MIKLTALLNEQSLHSVMVEYCKEIASDIESHLKKKHKAKTRRLPVTKSQSAWFIVEASDMYTRGDLEVSLVVVVETVQGSKISAAHTNVRIEIDHPLRGKIEEEQSFDVKIDSKEIVSFATKIIDVWVDKS